MNALTVTLNETCDGKGWYTSTKELQLTSFEFCMACRNFQTLHLKVDSQIPRRLLAAADAPPPHPKRLGSTRVPRLRARRVTWNMRTAAEWRNPIFAMMGVECLLLGDAFEGSLEAVVWPPRLKTMEFAKRSRFDQPVDLVEWPASLQRLGFNQPIDRVEFLASLRQLVFYGSSTFNQPIAGVNLPTSLLELDLGVQFNQPIEDIVWPPSLRKLKLGYEFELLIQRVVFQS
ncbi:unnamed protein product [Ectocarpus sp. 12 AP-2014]